jgi:hypothetical protein
MMTFECCDKEIITENEAKTKDETVSLLVRRYSVPRASILNIVQGGRNWPCGAAPHWGAAGQVLPVAPIEKASALTLDQL